MPAAARSRSGLRSRAPSASSSSLTASWRCCRPTSRCTPSVPMTGSSRTRPAIRRTRTPSATGRPRRCAKRAPRDQAARPTALLRQRPDRRGLRRRHRAESTGALETDDHAQPSGADAEVRLLRGIVLVMQPVELVDHRVHLGLVELQNRLEPNACSTKGRDIGSPALGPGRIRLDSRRKKAGVRERQSELVVRHALDRTTELVTVRGHETDRRRASPQRADLAAAESHPTRAGAEFRLLSGHEADLRRRNHVA